MSECNDKNAMAVLGELICRLNPYTDMPKYGLTGRTTGPMDIFTRSPSSSDTSLYSQVQVDVDRDYDGTWVFKGEPQKINTAVRIPYRYPVYGKDGKTPAYWLTDYLLIGFEGMGGG